eukprot:COSAG01_NODE_1055_length_11904_cov_16.177213_9_plen_93_part_00
MGARPAAGAATREVWPKRGPPQALMARVQPLLPPTRRGSAVFLDSTTAVQYYNVLLVRSTSTVHLCIHVVCSCWGTHSLPFIARGATTYSIL